MLIRFFPSFVSRWVDLILARVLGPRHRVESVVAKAGHGACGGEKVKLKRGTEVGVIVVAPYDGVDKATDGGKR